MSEAGTFAGPRRDNRTEGRRASAQPGPPRGATPQHIARDGPEYRDIEAGINYWGSVGLLGAILLPFALVAGLLEASWSLDTLPSIEQIALTIRWQYFVFLVASVIVGTSRWIWLRRQPERADRFVRTYVRWRPIGRAHAIVLLSSLFLAVFVQFKKLIPALHPFSWDGTFAAMDRVLHGTDPWRIIHPLTAHEPVTYLLVVVYGPAWMLLWIGVLTWIAWTTREALRQRYLVAHCALWLLLGIGLAMVLSSAGPAFFHNVHPGEPNPYGPLMAYLQQAVPLIVDQQTVMWSVSGRPDPEAMLRAISAAPSMHMAVAFLSCIVLRRIGAGIAAAAWLVTALIFISTIHLGWHYAVDAYISLVGVLIVWRLTRRIESRAVAHS